MPSGLNVWDASGVLTLDTGDRLGIILGSQNRIPQSGSVVSDGFSLGEPFYLTQMAVKWQDQRGFVLPTVVINGNTLSWSNAGTDAQWRILWGVR